MTEPDTSKLDEILSLLKSQKEEKERKERDQVITVEQFLIDSTKAPATLYNRTFVLGLFGKVNGFEVESPSVNPRKWKNHYDTTKIIKSNRDRLI